MPTWAGRYPLDVDMPVFECMVVEFAHHAHEGAVGFGVVVFGDGDGGVRAVCERVECVFGL